MRNCLGNKRRIWQKCLLGFVLLLLLAVSVPVPAQAAATVRINPSKTSVYVGGTKSLSIIGTKKKVVWSSENKKIATVSSKGIVTGKKAGTTVITARVSKKSYRCRVTVKNPYLNKQKLTMDRCTTYSLKLTGVSVKKWSSTNNKVATVTSKGVVTARKMGSATIKCLAKNGKTYTCKLSVGGAPTHSYAWKRTGNSRILRCSVCGATTGEREYLLAKGVWGYEADASALMKRVNNVRSNTWIEDMDGGVTLGAHNPVALKYSAKLCKKAKTYALNTDNLYLDNYHWGGSEEIVGGLIGWGPSNPTQAYEGWCFYPDRIFYMASDSFTKIGYYGYYWDFKNNGDCMPVWIIMME